MFLNFYGSNKKIPDLLNRGFILYQIKSKSYLMLFKTS